MLNLLSHVWLCDSMNGSPPGSSALGILQARVLEWYAMPPLPGDLPDSGIKLKSPEVPALVAEGEVFTTSAMCEALSLFFKQEITHK